MLFRRECNAEQLISVKIADLCFKSLLQEDFTMFKNVKKIVVTTKKEKAETVIVVGQRSQCRTTHKRKDC